MPAFQINPCTDMTQLAESATAILPKTTTAIYVPVAGTVQCMMANASSMVTVALTAGWHPLQIKMLGTGTLVDVWGGFSN